MNSSTKLELADFLIQYPDGADTPDFQRQLTGYKEFQDVMGLPMEELPDRGKPYRHQEIITKFLAEVGDKVIIAHDPGTGKTCTIIQAAENLLRDDNSFINHVIALSPSDILVKEFKKQLICSCTEKGVYDVDKINEAKNEKGQLQVISNIIKKNYTVRTFGSFIGAGNKIADLSDEEIREQYKGSLIFIDEVHKLVPDEEEYNETSNEERAITKANAKMKADQYFHIKRFLRALIGVCKIVISSADLMTNRPEELTFILNLVLDNDLNIPEGFYNQTADQIADGLDIYLRDKVSFVRAFNTGAVPSYQGITLNKMLKLANGTKVKSETVIYPVKMITGGLQDTTYSEITKRKGFRTQEQSTATFVYPDGSYGETGYKRFIYEKNGLYYMNDELRQYLDPAINPDAFENLKEMSIVYYNIIYLIVMKPIGFGVTFVYSHFNRSSGVILLGLILELYGFDRFNEKTSVFRTIGGKSKLEPFCGDVKRVRQVALPDSNLPQNRFRYALITPEATSGNRGNVMLEALISPENIDGGIISVVLGSPASQSGININHGTRFILAGAEWNEAIIHQAMFRIFRAPSHLALRERYKQYLLSQGISEEDAQKRLDIEVEIYKMAAVASNGRSIDVEQYLDYAETKDRNIKPTLRALKMLAFDCILNRGRNIRLDTDEQGSRDCDYQDCDYPCKFTAPDIIIRTNYDNIYAGPLVAKIKQIIMDKFKYDFIYKLSELYIELIESEQNKIDGNINKRLIDRSIVELINDKTIIYDKYGYVNFLQVNGNLIYIQKEYPNWSTFKGQNYESIIYNRLLTGKKSELISDIVNELIEPKQLAYIEMLNQVVQYEDGSFDQNQLTYVLEQLNIKYSSDLLENAIEIDTYKMILSYSDNYVPPEDPNIKDESDKYLGSFREYYRRFIPNITDDQILDKIRTRLEEVQAKYNLNEDLIGNIIKYYSDFVYFVDEPIIWLNKQNNLLLSKEVKVGRPRLTNKPKDIIIKDDNYDDYERELLIPYPNPNLVYFHSRYIYQARETKYGEQKQKQNLKGRLRMFKIVEMKWRDPDDIERVGYAAIGQLENIKRESNTLNCVFPNGCPIYGKVVRNANTGEYQFYIIDKTAERLEGKTMKISGRQMVTGLISTSWKIINLILLMYKMNVEYNPNMFQVPFIDDNVTSEEMINFIYSFKGYNTIKDTERLEDYSVDKLRFFYGYLAMNFDTATLVNNIYQVMNQNSLLIY